MPLKFSPSSPGLIKPATQQFDFNPKYGRPIFCSLLNPNLGDITGKRHLLQQVGPPSNVVSTAGPALRFAGVGPVTYSSFTGEFTGDITVILVWQRHIAAAGFQELVNKRNSDTTAEFVFNFSDGVAYQFGWSSGGVFTLLDFGAANIPGAGVLAKTVAIRSGVVASGWQNGVNLGSSSLTAGTIDAQTLDLCIGAYERSSTSSFGENLTADVYFAAILPYSVSPAVGKYLSQNPYDLLVPKRPGVDSQIWIPSSASSPSPGMVWGPRRSSRPWTGGARAFNGSSDVITTSRNFDAVAPITVFAWINLATANLDSTFFAAGGTQGLQVRLSSANKLQIIRTNVAIILTSSNAISATGIWVPALVSTDGTDAVTWLEGTRTTAGVGGALLTDPRPYFIGCAADSSNNKLQFWPGSIAHLAVWNRPLRDEEWHQLASGTPPNKIRPGALLAYWPLDGYEAAAKDLSAYGNNGILTGTTLSVGPPYLKNTILQPDINSLFWIPQTTGAAPPPVTGGLGALLSTERSRLINSGFILS